MIFGFIKQFLLHVLVRMANVSKFTTCISLNNQTCMTIPTLIDLNPDEYNMITKTNESKTLRKHISCECKCKFDGRKCNSNQKWNNGKCQCECKNLRKRHANKNIIFGVLVHIIVKIVNI